MPIRAALTIPAVKRVIALIAVYGLVLQALFGAGAQIRVLLTETAGLCTILGYQNPDQPKHAHDGCAIHCVGQAASDGAGLAAIAAIVMAVAVWGMTQRRAETRAPRLALAFQGRGPPR